MANYCDYEIRVIGSKNAGLMVYESMPCMDFKNFEWEKSSENYTTIHFTGNCKWSVNFGVTDNLNYVNVDAMSESEIESKGIDYWDYSLRAKSEAFQCEIMVHYWSEESGFDQFDHYKNGKILKQRKIEYNYDEPNEFDWDKLEFIGYEGEYDENVDGEQQNEDLMAILMALGGTMPSDASEESEENQDELSAATANLVDLLDKIEALAAEAGIDLDDGSIGDTGFDMYNWNFSQGNIAKGDGWTIAIPDGFVQINSRGDEPITGKKRIFELVPVTYQYENDIDKVPIRILPGDMQDIQNLEMVHPNARAGIAGAIGVTNAEVMSQLLGNAPELLVVGWEDAAAHIMVQDTSGGTYSYQCSIIAKGKLQQLRVQTQFVTDKQKQSLSVSVQEWLKTMKFNKNNKAAAKTKFEEKDCLDELLIGKTERLEEAVKQAHTEYLAAINGRMKMLEFMGKYDLLDEHTGETIREILESGMAVKLFFLEKADALVNKLQKNNLNAALLEDVIKKLADLDEDLLDYNYGDEVIEITVPEKAQAIRDKWQKIAPDAFCAESKEEQARLKAIEESKKKREAQEKVDADALKISSDFKEKIRTIKDTYEKNVYYHKRMIERHTFTDLWDPDIQEYISQLDADIQGLGSGIEELLLEAVDLYNEVTDEATPKVVIAIIEAMEDAIKYIEETSIHIESVDATLEYDWNLNVYGMKRELRRAKLELKKEQSTLEKEENWKENENNHSVQGSGDRLNGNTLADFIQSGQNEASASKVRLTGIEAEIVCWFREKNEMYALEDIKKHFYDCPPSEVQRALDRLVEKGIIYGGANFIGNMYGLSNADEAWNYEIDNDSVQFEKERAKKLEEEQRRKAEEAQRRKEEIARKTQEENEKRKEQERSRQAEIEEYRKIQEDRRKAKEEREKEEEAKKKAEENRLLREAEEARKNEIYAKAMSCIDSGELSKCKEAVELLASIQNWKDSYRKMSNLRKQIELMEAELAEKKKKTKKIFMGVCIVLLIAAVFFLMPKPADDSQSGGAVSTNLGGFMETNMVENKGEFVAITMNSIKRVDSDSLTVTLKKEAPVPDSNSITEHINGYPIVLAEKIVEDGNVSYTAIKGDNLIKCTDGTVYAKSNYREEPDQNYGLYGERNDAYSIYVYNLFADEIGTYTLQYGKEQIQIQIKLPECGLYTEPEAALDKQMLSQIKKGDVVYMIVSEPEQYETISFNVFEEDDASAVNLEQMGEYGEICKITAVKSGAHIRMQCVREFADGSRDDSGNGFYIE